MFRRRGARLRTAATWASTVLSADSQGNMDVGQPRYVAGRPDSHDAPCGRVPPCTSHHRAWEGLTVGVLHVAVAAAEPSAMP